MKQLEALFDAVIVKPIEEDESKFGSIVVPDMGNEKNKQATVVDVGPGKFSITGDHFINTVLKVGDRVVLPSMGFTKLEFEGEEYFIGCENSILAKIN